MNECVCYQQTAHPYALPPYMMPLCIDILMGVHSAKCTSIGDRVMWKITVKPV